MTKPLPKPAPFVPGYYLEPVVRKSKMFPDGFPPNFEPLPYTPPKTYDNRGGWDNGTIFGLSEKSAETIANFKDKP